MAAIGFTFGPEVEEFVRASSVLRLFSETSVITPFLFLGLPATSSVHDLHSPVCI
jgi:hypothetical protein